MEKVDVRVRESEVTGKEIIIELPHDEKADKLLRTMVGLGIRITCIGWRDWPGEKERRMYLNIPKDKLWLIVHMINVVV